MSRFPEVPRLRGPAMLCCLAVAAFGTWALWPLRAIDIKTPAIDAQPAAPQDPGVPPLDLAAFHAPLWVAQPGPPPPPAPAPPPAPMRLQLIAIVRESGAFKAALYDPDQDRLVIAGRGESIAGREIRDVRAGDVMLLDAGQSRTLSLKPEGGAP